MSEKPVSLSDVATLAGVSVSTASKVLNGGGRVSPETRKRIEDVAARLDFRPNALARFFATGKSQTIGVLTSEAPSMFAMPVLLGAQSALGRREMATLLYSVQYDLRALGDVVRKLRARQVDGVVVIGDGLERPLHSISHSLSVPVVYALGVSESPDDLSVTPDGRMVGHLAAQHLLDIGRRRIVHVTGPTTDLAAVDRVRGLNETLGKAGVGLAGAGVMYGDWSRGWGVRAASRLLEGDRDFDAIFCGNDQIATGVHMTLRMAGVRIPDDVAIVGVDNVSSLLRQPDGLITTVDTNLAAVGEAAAGYLLGAPEAAQPGVHYEPCALVPGESTMGTRPGAAADEELYLEI
ncbi:LacI family DNA-binding transcriptional regulator [Gryllotalpicola reticulitermitis]|uniref:LacI family DNA-binding transcriptional regulator n=1 Tax=Gryllotalpicola reticulitermitis TaxID=1184153 RepID=A0ABV8Q737_9MICO